jgi:mycothiol synthase
MLWPKARLAAPPELSLQPEYALRIFRPGEDEEGYLSVMHAAGFTQFDDASVARCLERALPDGFFVVEHAPSGEIVATAQANHAPKPLHPFGGELGWVAASPAHSGKGLGAAVCAAVVRRFISAGYRRIYLLTDDWRLPALKVYLKLGFVPFLFEAGMAARWEAVCEQVSWPFTPDAWPKAPS